MSTPDQQLAVSTRFVRRVFALACLASLLLTAPAQASSTVLGFGQLNPNDVITATDNGNGTTTLSTTSALNKDGGGLSVPVNVTNFLGTPFPSGFTVYETFVGVVSDGPASSFHGLVFENFSGKIEFTSGINGTGANYLTAVFAPITMMSATGVGGSGGGASAFLTGAEPPDTLTLTSDFATFANPTGMNLSFSNITPALSIDSTTDPGNPTLYGFTGQNAGTFSAAIPEPSTLTMASVAVVLGALGYWRRKAAKR